MAPVHITFGTQQLSESVATLAASAARWGIGFHGYDPRSEAILRTARENPEIAKLERGAGYWIWKAYILLDAFDRASDGDVIIYTDAAMSYVSDPAPLFARLAESDIVLFNCIPLPGTHRYWTKRDCLVRLGADNPENWDERLVQGGVQIYRVGPQAREFVTEWKEAMRDPQVLTDSPNLSGLPNFPEYIEHRHDMSVLTVIATRHGIKRTRSAGIPPRAEDVGDYPKIFDQHKRRNDGQPRNKSLIDAVEQAAMTQ
jgi:hypothetical protein